MIGLFVRTLSVAATVVMTVPSASAQSAELIDRFNDFLGRLCSTGEGAVMKYGSKIPPYRETQNYVKKIMNHYDLISNQNSTLAGSSR